MQLAEFVVAEAVLPEMEVADKEDAIHQLVAALSAAGAVPKRKATAIRKEVLERETQASTGIGNGVGIPHARSTNMKKLVLAVGRVPEGIDYGAVDGESVRVLLLLISPKGEQEQHLAAMRSIVKIVRDPYQCKRLLGCRTAESFLDLLKEIG